MNRSRILFAAAFAVAAMLAVFSCEKPEPQQPDQPDTPVVDPNKPDNPDNPDKPDNPDNPNPPDPPKTYSVGGSVQKGPFTQGTSITIQALDESLNPTGKNYNTKTTDDAGSFAIDNQIESRYVELIALGYYFNEVAGRVSASQITLRSISDLTEEGSTNINLLTTLEADRVRALAKGGKTLREAREQAEKELFGVFNIPDQVTADAGFDKMDITRGGNANGILLAISASLQSDRTEGELSELASKIAGELSTSGKVESSLIRSQIREGGVSKIVRVRQDATDKVAELTLEVTPGFFREKFNGPDSYSFLTMLSKVVKLKIKGSINEDDTYAIDNSYNADLYFNALTELDLSELTIENDILNCFSYLPKLEKVLLPNHVEAIGAFAFNDCPSLKEIVFGEDSEVTEIRGEIQASALSSPGYYGAFKNCTSLERVVLPDDLRKLEAGAFMGCSSLREIVFPNPCRILELEETEGYYDTGLKRVYVYMGHFNGCDALETIQIPSSVKKIGGGAFSGWSGLKHIEIPSSVINLETDYLFSGCANLESVRLPSSVEEYGAHMFEGCTSLRSVEGPTNLSRIGDYAFAGCSEQFVLLDPNVEYGSYVFSGSNIRRISFPAGFKNVPKGMFNNCLNIESIDFGEVETIDDNAFGGWFLMQDANYNNVEKYSPITSVALPSSVKSIGNSAFAGWKKLSSFTMNSERIAFGSSVFSDCTSLTTLTIPASMKAATRGDGYPLDGSSITRIVFEEGCAIEEFGIAAGSKIQSIEMPASVKTVPDFAFRECSELRTVSMTGVETIGEEAFYNCQKLRGVTFGDHLTSIGATAFKNCKKLDGISLPKPLKSIGEYAFEGCADLQNVTLAEDIALESIGGHAFDNCPISGAWELPHLQKLYLTSFNGTYITEFKCLGLKEMYGDGIKLQKLYLSNVIEKIIGEIKADDMYVFRQVPPSANNCSGLASSPNLKRIHVPSDKGDAYKAAWPSVADRIVADIDLSQYTFPEQDPDL